jgi:hypothetical protein
MCWSSAWTRIRDVAISTGPAGFQVDRTFVRRRCECVLRVMAIFVNYLLPSLSRIISLMHENISVILPSFFLVQGVQSYISQAPS